MLDTFRNDYIMVMVCPFYYPSLHFDLVKRVKFGVAEPFVKEDMERMAWKFACWLILTTFTTYYIRVMVCSFH